MRQHMIEAGDVLLLYGHDAVLSALDHDDAAEMAELRSRVRGIAAPLATAPW